MTTATAKESVIRAPVPHPDTLDELVKRLGDIPLSRILVDPAPTTATEGDLLEASRKHDKLLELVDGVLVEKAMGYRESLLALLLDISARLCPATEPRTSLRSRRHCTTLPWTCSGA